MKTSTVAFPYDRDTARNAVLWLLHRHGGRLDRPTLLKLAFLADLRHVRLYGFPVVGGRYAATPDGPVAVELDDDITAADCPFRSSSRCDVETTAQANAFFLSEADIETLRRVTAAYGDAGPAPKLPGVQAGEPVPYEAFFSPLPEEHRRKLGVPEDCRAMLEVVMDNLEAWRILIEDIQKRHVAN